MRHVSKNLDVTYNRVRLLLVITAVFSILQEIEDVNVMHKFDRRLERLAMVMPLTDLFDPGVTQFAHEHLQVSKRVRIVAFRWACILPRQRENAKAYRFIAEVLSNSCATVYNASGTTQR